ncbi:serine hydrolase domain-containing protein [Chryseobacterium sp.]|jgi:D-alanyl-D-alanine carboxypeptidase|uniref:serine hydrolase domain-containing protein n=1 Tax=Chryseobacterium sp. TaxID=1871047 RepID=UPI00284A3E50|nr:serine hydrolase domain-containing protein [Chryseobacterium sp.]MDR3025389.1 beta-lactamase family protein [Chryseobacterium sp.]
MRLLLSLTVSVALSSSAFAQNTEAIFKKIVDSTYNAHPEMIGLIVDVESPDHHISWRYATGHNGNKSNAPIDPEQPLLIASTTKPFMAAAVLRLVENGKISIDDPLKGLLTSKTVKVLSDAGYDLDKINLRHLLSHTSGINDYVTENYFSFISSHKNHQWTRYEQIALAGKEKKLGEPGTVFRYADINYVLISEIIEQKTGKPFYEALRSLLDYKKLGLNNTWFIQLEKQPAKSLPLVNQYWKEFDWEIKDLNPSWDLYGGGGIASNVKDMAQFFQLLFNGKVIKDQKVLQLMSTDVPPNLDINYCLGIRKIKSGGMTAYNHGGGLGTDAIYIPEINASIASASVEAGKRSVAVELNSLLASKLKKLKKD